MKTVFSGAKRPTTGCGELTKATSSLCLDLSQKGKWRDFMLRTAEIAARHRAAADALKARSPDHAPSFPEQIELRLTALRANADALGELRAVVDALYAALTIQQQRQADRILARVFWEIMQSGRGFRITAADLPPLPPMPAVSREVVAPLCG